MLCACFGVENIFLGGRAASPIPPCGEVPVSCIYTHLFFYCLIIIGIDVVQFIEILRISDRLSESGQISNICRNPDRVIYRISCRIGHLSGLLHAEGYLMSLTLPAGRELWTFPRPLSQQSLIINSDYASMDSEEHLWSVERVRQAELYQWRRC